MNIGYSFIDLAMGGAQTFLLQLAAGMQQRGHQIRYHLYADLADQVHAVPFLVEKLNAIAQPVQNPKELLECDVIQLDGYHSLQHKLPYLFALDRCVETFHSTYSIRRSGPVYAKNRVAISQTVRSRLKGPAEIIYYGIPLPPECQVQASNYDVAILGRINPVKQHLLFLRACEFLYLLRGKLKALIIGDHPSLSPYQEQVDQEIERLRELGLEIEVSGMLPTEQVYQKLAQTRVLMATSKSEGFGRMALEAMACCVPVIANPVGGLKEIVQDGKTGYFASLNDAASFAKMADRLLNNEDARRLVGEQGRTLVEKRFTLVVMIDSYERLYRRIARSI